MKKFLPLIAFAIILLSCKKNEEISQIPFLREKFQGNYEIISSYSKTPVDLNNDGVESSDLLTELPRILNDAELYFRIPYRYDENKVFLIDEVWPTENVQTNGYLNGYYPFLNRFDGTFADDFKSANIKILYPDDDGNTLIEINIEFLEDETIKAIAKRKLYTSSGWVTTEIESVYRRYYKGT